VAIEGVVPEADVLGGATSGPEVPIAPEITEEVHDDVLPESSMGVVRPIARDPRRRANAFGVDARSYND
jgi:hypothetical protein